ncbi:MAG: hypothetical protein RL119_37 [Actinomycetota bacterium]
MANDGFLFPQCSMRLIFRSQSVSRQWFRILLGIGAVSLVTPLQVHAGESSTSCPPYEIEGSIETASGAEGSMSQASVFVHNGDQPLADYQVFATFSSAGNEPVGEPLMMTTDSAGRAAVAVPEGALSVSFVAEGPDNPACSVPEGTEPSVALEIFPVSGVSPEDGESEAVVDLPGNGELAYTGPVSTGVVAAAVLAAAAGCGVWMGRGRKVRLSSR